MKRPFGKRVSIKRFSMKRFSIKTRVTIWYVFFLVLLVSLLVASIIYTSHRLIQSDLKRDLAAVVESSLKYVSIEGGRLEVEDDMPGYRDGVYLLVYQENNFLVTGILPEDISGEIPFISQQVRKIRDNGQEFYVYDYLMDEKLFDNVWVRGITAADLAGSDPAVAFMMKLFVICLPLLILAAAIGGYTITKRLFRPVSRIIETAGKIEAGTDLSQRIGLTAEGGSKDEIYHLSATFDKMLDRLERSFESEKQFSNDASHELRTPVSVIRAQCEYALKSAETLEDAQAAMEVILDQAKKMSALINQLLTLARAEQGTMSLEFEELNISELVHMVALEQQQAASRKNIEIKQEIQADIVACVDEALFLRLWMNLISNSIQYGKEGGFVRIVLEQKGDTAIGKVIDNGIGIGQEALPKIWDRFFQENPSRSLENSAGLGLSMVKWIISALNGHIEARSTPEQGTSFTFEFPLKYHADADQTASNGEACYPPSAFI
ncbi:MAG: HAMP domain-containing histidine kinase [Firmicutes bacterium]|nr:HAMP domain-containing histidine kinase [Bacillota bacterium]